MLACGVDLQDMFPTDGKTKCGLRKDTALLHRYLRPTPRQRFNLCPVSLSTLFAVMIKKNIT